MLTPATPAPPVVPEWSRAQLVEASRAKNVALAISRDTTASAEVKLAAMAKALAGEKANWTPADQLLAEYQDK
jgi:hypothetical protein